MTDPLRRALLVSYSSVIWGAISGALSITFGVVAHSVALIGAGAAVLADLISSVVLVHRFRSGHEDPAIERRAQAVSAWCLIVVGLGLLVASALRLAAGEGSEPDGGAIAVAAAGLVILPVLARTKLGVAPLVDSHALRLDAYISLVGAATAGLTLVSLALTSAFNWTSADSWASIVIALLAGGTGVRELRG